MNDDSSAAMRLDLFRSLWGWPTGPGADWARCGAECRENGFVGVEARLPADPFARRALKAALAGEGLDYIAVVFTGGDVIPDQRWTVAQHLDRLSQAIDGAREVGARFINVLPGNDRWPIAMQVDLFGRAQGLADAAGIMFRRASAMIRGRKCRIRPRSNMPARWPGTRRCGSACGPVIGRKAAR